LRINQYKCSEHYIQKTSLTKKLFGSMD